MHRDVASKSASASAPEKPKAKRKKKEVGPDGKPIADDKPKEKKPRKPREPKDPNKPAAPRKKQKIGETTEKVRSYPDESDHFTPDLDIDILDTRLLTISTQIAQNAPSASTNPSRQPTISDMMGGQHQPQPAYNTTAPSHPQQQATTDNAVRSSVPPYLSNPTPSRPSSSGQNYDPIRGSTVESSRPSQPPPVVPSNGPPSSHASPHTNRASPSIASLVNPPQTAIKTSAPPAYPQQTFPQPSVVPSQQQSPPPKTTTHPFPPPPQQASPPISR